MTLYWVSYKFLDQLDELLYQPPALAAHFIRGIPPFAAMRTLSLPPAGEHHHHQQLHPPTPVRLSAAPADELCTAAPARCRLPRETRRRQHHHRLPGHGGASGRLREGLPVHTGWQGLACIAAATGIRSCPAGRRPPIPGPHGPGAPADGACAPPRFRRQRPLLRVLCMWRHRLAGLRRSSCCWKWLHHQVAVPVPDCRRRVYCQGRWPWHGKVSPPTDLMFKGSRCLVCTINFSIYHWIWLSGAWRCSDWGEEGVHHGCAPAGWPIIEPDLLPPGSWLSLPRTNWEQWRWRRSCFSISGQNHQAGHRRHGGGEERAPDFCQWTLGPKGLQLRFQEAVLPLLCGSGWSTYPTDG